jgi:hypothetical protein
MSDDSVDTFDFYGEIEFSGSLPVTTMKEVRDEIQRLFQEIEGKAGIEFMSVKWISDNYGEES